ncbi:MAG: FAD binding domain-containing protein [Aestuariivirga sp.]
MLQAVIAPDSLVDTSRALLKAASPKLIAGGTVVMPVINTGQHEVETLVSLRNLHLSKIAVSKSGKVTIGAATPISDLAKKKELAFLVPAIESIASPSIRNMATVGGNLFVEQPYGDLAVCLIALGTTAIISKGKAEREERVEVIAVKGVKAGEIVTKISFVVPASGTFKYHKASRRNLNSASIVTVAAVIPVEKNLIKNCRVALGGVAPRPVRAKRVEKLLEGKPLNLETVSAAATAAAGDINPFDDAYASAWYRGRVTPVHIRRAIIGQ